MHEEDFEITKKKLYESMLIKEHELFNGATSTYSAASEQSKLDDAKIKQAIKQLYIHKPDIYIDSLVGNREMFRQFGEMIVAGKEIKFENSIMADNLTGIPIIISEFMPDGKIMLCANGKVVGIIDLVEMVAYLWKGKRYGIGR